MFGEPVTEVRRWGREAFIMQTHSTICDHHTEELRRRNEALDRKFGFICKVISFSHKEIIKASGELMHIYPWEFERDLADEFCHFKSVIHNKDSRTFCERRC